MVRLILRSSILLSLILSLYGTTVGEVNFCSWYTESIQCQTSEFRCLNGKKCINRELYCNSENNCDDNSDERYCSVTSCPEEFSSCDADYDEEWKCVPNKWVCNGYNDCANGKDESSCRIPTRKRYYRKGTSVSVKPAIETATAKDRTAVNKVKRWISLQRNDMTPFEQWGSNVDKLALILYLAEDGPTVRDTFSDKAEMANELRIHLLSQLSSMKLADVPSTELAAYVNAFLVTCVNPRKFHGHDIVKELRNRVDQDNYTNPYVFLALCNAGETITDSDKTNLINIFANKHRTFWTDMQAVVIMALACARKQPSNEVDSDILREMAQELKEQQLRNGTVVNLPTTALVMQALISTGFDRDPDNFDEAKAYQELLRNQKTDGSFGDLINTFLVAPVLTCKSLVDISASHCEYESTDENSALENLSNRSGPKIRVQYSLWIGNNRDLERNLILRVPQNMSLYSVMEIAADVDFRFKFEYSVKDRKPYISAISGMKDNPLTGKFWFLYVIQDDKPVLSNKSPADIVPKDNEHFVMWYRRGTWVD